MTYPKKHYVDNKKFLDELTLYKEQVKIAEKDKKEKPILSNYIGECFIRIANNLSRAPNFNSYTFRDEMVCDGIENCIQYVDNFDPLKSKNPFAYFTQIIYFAFVRRILKERKQLYVKYKSAENFSLLNMNNNEEEFDGDVEKNGNKFQIYDNISEFIDTFETKSIQKKQKIKKSKLEKRKTLKI